MIDVLVVSQSCLTAVNRAPYRVLRKRGWSVEIVVPKKFVANGFSRSADPAAGEDPPIHELEIRRAHPRLWRFPALRALLRSRRPRVIILDVDPGSILALEVGSWARRSGVKVACISCDNLDRTVATEARRSILAGAKLMISRTLVAAGRFVIDHVFVLSSTSQRLMERLGFQDRVTLMPLGFDPLLFRPDQRVRAETRKALGLTDVTFAYFGRLTPEKGAHLLLQALERLKNHPWQLLLDEFSEYQHPYASQLRGLIDTLGFKERIVFFDARHEEMGRYMNAADIVVMPSVSSDVWSEQYGRVAPEAMACGRVVVVSDCGALPEVVGDDAIVIPQADVSALADALSRVYENETLRRDIGPRAAEHAIAHHSLGVQVDRMERVLNRWLEKPSSVS
jgi:glycosyltransferase involved in cell wall biosynthesis